MKNKNKAEAFPKAFLYSQVFSQVTTSYKATE